MTWDIFCNNHKSPSTLCVAWRCLNWQGFHRTTMKIRLRNDTFRNTQRLCPFVENFNEYVNLWIAFAHKSHPSFIARVTGPMEAASHEIPMDYICYKPPKNQTNILRARAAITRQHQWTRSLECLKPFKRHAYLSVHNVTHYYTRNPLSPQ